MFSRTNTLYKSYQRISKIFGFQICITSSKIPPKWSLSYSSLKFQALKVNNCLHLIKKSKMVSNKYNSYHVYAFKYSTVDKRSDIYEKVKLKLFFRISHLVSIYPLPSSSWQELPVSSCTPPVVYVPSLLLGGPASPSPAATALPFSWLLHPLLVSTWRKEMEITIHFRPWLYRQTKVNLASVCNEQLWMLM